MDITLEAVRRLDPKEAKDAIKVNYENLRVNGGTLAFRFQNVFYDLAVLAKNKDTVIGYVLLAAFHYDTEKTRFCKELYVTQVAVDSKYKRMGVGTAMYNYVYEHMEGFNRLRASVHSSNDASHAFHQSFGFVDNGKSLYGSEYVKPVGKEVTLTFADAKKEKVTLGKDKEMSPRR